MEEFSTPQGRALVKQLLRKRPDLSTLDAVLMVKGMLSGEEIGKVAEAVAQGTLDLSKEKLRARVETGSPAPLEKLDLNKMSSQEIEKVLVASGRGPSQ